MQPQVLNKDVITIKVMRGYDIFIFSESNFHVVLLSPEKWQQGLEK